MYQNIKQQVFTVYAFCFLLRFNASARGWSDDKGVCDKLLESFASTTAPFTYCAIRNARPVTFCESCISEYIEVLQSYDQIFNSNVTDESGQPCRVKLLNLDRLAIIDVVFKSLSGLWQRGECDYCFEKSSNGTVTSDQRNTTVEFNRRYLILKQCIDEHSNDTNVPVCQTCHKPYHQVNKYYNYIKIRAAEEDGDNVCMDIVDLMNATRSKWSRELHCLPHRQAQTPLFVTGGLILLTPVLFYVISMLLPRPDSENSRATPGARRRLSGASSAAPLAS